jgi:hypothetical protein
MTDMAAQSRLQPVRAEMPDDGEVRAFAMASSVSASGPKADHGGFTLDSDQFDISASCRYSIPYTRNLCLGNGNCQGALRPRCTDIDLPRMLVVAQCVAS